MGSSIFGGILVSTGTTPGRVPVAVRETRWHHPTAHTRRTTSNNRSGNKFPTRNHNANTFCSCVSTMMTQFWRTKYLHQTCRLHHSQHPIQQQCRWQLPHESPFQDTRILARVMWVFICGKPHLLPPREPTARNENKSWSCILIRQWWKVIEIDRSWLWLMKHGNY